MKPSRIGTTVGLLTVVGLISAAAVLRAAKPAPPSPTSATVTFRCYASGDTSPLCGEDPLVEHDDVRDDGLTYTTGTIGSTGMYLVRLTAAARRRLNLYFYEPVTGPSCVTSGNCNPDGPFYGEPQPLMLDDIELRTKPLVDGTWDDLPGGLFAMSCTATSSPGMVHFTFWLPSGNGHWGLNFNPRSAAGSTAVRIKRTALRQWTVSATAATVPPSNLGGLLSWGHSGLRGKNGPSIEGVFRVPFLFTIEAAATASVPNGNCTP
jgi:hypothetical protein